MSQKPLRILIALAVALPIIFLANGPSHFACQRLEAQYVLCKQHRRGVLGLFPKGTREFQLDSATVEATEHTEEDEEENVTGHYYTYSLYLIPKQGRRIFFQYYDSNSSKAHRKQRQIYQYIKGEGDPKLRYTNYGFWTFFANTLWVGCGAALGVAANEKIMPLLSSKQK